MLLSRFSPVCVCLQETLLGDLVHSAPSGYRGFFSTPLPGQGRHGGSAVFVRNDVPFSLIQLRSNLQVVAVRVFLHKLYTICSLYLPPGDRVTRRELDCVARALPSPSVLLGDFNGRSPMWCDTGVLNARGALLGSFIEDEGFEVLNSGEATHFYSQSGVFNSLDVTLCTSNCFLDFNWRVLPDLHGSDHFPILVESCNPVPCHRPPRWLLGQADWQYFSRLTSSIRPLTEFADCNEATTYFTDFLHSSAVQSVPRTSGRFVKRPVPWWNSTCAAAVKAKRVAFSRLRRHRDDPYCLDAFRKARAHALRVLKEARRNSWKNYVSITVRTPLTAVFNKVRKFSGKFSPPPPPVLLHAGNTVADPDNLAEMFGAHFASISQRDPAAPGTRYRQALEAMPLEFTSPGGESYNLPFSSSELKSAMHQCQDSTPGIDEVPYRFLRHLSDDAFTFLLGLYNFIWRTGDFPLHGEWLLCYQSLNLGRIISRLRTTV